MLQNKKKSQLVISLILYISLTTIFSVICSCSHQFLKKMHLKHFQV